MDKQPKLIDTDKLLGWLGEIIPAHIMFGQNERVYAYKDVKERIMSGAFDPIPLPTIKLGDYVNHKDHPEWGIGRVHHYYKDGSGARCFFPDLRHGDKTKYLSLDELEAISHD
ncbi:hypothetical protein D3C74_361090 [compost metagenome]